MSTNATSRNPLAHDAPAGIDRRRLLIGGLATLATAGAFTATAGLLTPSRAQAASIGNVLRPGQQLNRGQSLLSPNGVFEFRMQNDDGNGVLYNLRTGAALWSTRSNGRPGAFLANQGDGNVVCYTPGYTPGYTFASGTTGDYGTGDLVLQDDGNLVRYGGPSGWAWASGTDGGRNNLGSAGGTRAPLPASTRAAQVVNFARAQIGKPYQYGAAGPNTYDCSGLTLAAYKSIGITLGRTTYDQVKNGSPVSLAQLQPGDLVFPNADHVAICSGNGKWIEAAKPGTTVREVARWGNYWAGRRIV
ncbi:NlpC/P60 family protein [Kineococcus sp. SYSU DK003]|uniref:NlpC/P60 family protein n=1 Tax=Kineococcus sp. SYSU DK003 TaxID=3383124 RepID=UPI003D7CABAB